MLPYRPRQKAPTTFTQSTSRLWGDVTIEREHHPKWDTKKYRAKVDWSPGSTVVLMLRHVPREIRFRSQLLNEENVLDSPDGSLYLDGDPTREVEAIFETVRCGKRPFGIVEWKLRNSVSAQFEAFAEMVMHSSLSFAEFQYTVVSNRETPTERKSVEYRSIEFCVAGTVGENFDIDQLFQAYSVRSLLPNEIRTKILLQMEKAASEPVSDYLGKLARGGSLTPVWLQGLLYGEPVENTISHCWKDYQDSFKQRPRFCRTRLPDYLVNAAVLHTSDGR
jgi:hypothetical protein